MPSAMASGANAPVKFTVPGTSLTIKGFSSPGAFVKIFDGDTLIGTTIADGNGRFTKQFSSMSSGLHNFKMLYEDIAGNKSDTVRQTVNVRAQSETGVEYFLPPTVLVNPGSINEGGIVTISGYTIPNASVDIIIDGGSNLLNPVADKNGYYSISIKTDGYYFGNHSLNVKSKQGGLTSYQSLRRSFIILPPEDETNSQSSKVTSQAIDPPIIKTNNGSIQSDDNPTLISGTALPNSQIIIFIDGEAVGSTFSGPDGRWFFNVYITKTSQVLRAITCIDDICSDYSNLAEVVFQGDINKCKDLRFMLEDYRFWAISKGKGVDVNLKSINGASPFEVLIDWGDDVTEKFNRDTDRNFSVHHIYKNVGQYNGSITLSDSEDCEYALFFSVDVQSKGVNLWLLMSITPLLLVIYIVLKHRYHLRRQQLILAR